MGRILSTEVKHDAERLYYLDNFRTYLTTIVIYHHTAVGYGGVGNWFYQSRYHPQGSSEALVAFNAFNQTYFMASFFFLSSLMSTRALKRKSVQQFLRSKHIKLGIPVIVYTLLGGPAQIALSRLHSHEPLGLDILVNFWKSLRGVRGPVWYTALLLIFDTINALVPNSLPFNPPQFLTGVFLDVACNVSVRLLYPVGYIFVPLNLQLGYMTQYIASYALGSKFALFDSPLSQPPLPTAPNLIPLPSLTPATRNTLLASSIMSGAAIVGLLHYYPNTYSLPSLLGGLNSGAISYAIWNESTGYLIGSSLLGLFKRSALLSRDWGSTGRYSYAAFLVHPIVCVRAQLWTDNWNASGILKTLVVGTGGVLGSWVVGWAIVRVPGVGRVLA